SGDHFQKGLPSTRISRPDPSGSSKMNLVDYAKKLLHCKQALLQQMRASKMVESVEKKHD
ncbi:MAG: hypothetical protein M1816_001187, partial [Peltula sp. TS41687]